MGALCIGNRVERYGGRLKSLCEIAHACDALGFGGAKGRGELTAKEHKPRKRDIENYARTDKERVNNPPVGLMTPETDEDVARKTYAHDPHVDPQLSWAGKAEHAVFEVPTVSPHVDERIERKALGPP